MIGLIIGRFQPFHLGHIELIKTACNECDKVYVVLGSAHSPEDEHNPFTLEQRREMFRCVIEEYDLDIQLIELDDIPDDNEWVGYIEKSIPPFDIVYAGEEDDLNFFRNTRFKLKHIGRKHGIHATVIRKKIRNNDPSWKKDVPECIYKIVT